MDELIIWLVSNWCSDMLLHLDKKSSTCWSHSDDQISKSIQNIKSVLVSSIQKQRTFTQGFKPLLQIFLQQFSLMTA